MEYPTTEELKGKVLKSFEIDEDNDEILIETIEGEKYKYYHSQDCCEAVSINEVIGDVSDLLGEPLLIAEEVVSDDENPEGAEAPSEDWQSESFTWTFYKFATIKGYVTIRWYGESNGYYSESVDLAKADKEGNFSIW